MNDQNEEIAKLKLAQERIEANYRQMISQCELIERRAVAEKQQMMQKLEDASKRNESPDSEIYAELIDDFSSNSDNLVHLTAQLLSTEETAKDLRVRLDSQIEYSNQLKVVHAKSQAEMDLREKQSHFNEELYNIQGKTLEQLSGQLESQNSHIALRNAELLQLRNELLQNQCQIRDLLEENFKMNHLSKAMLHKLSVISNRLLEYRQDISHRDAIIDALRANRPSYIHQCSQTTVFQVCDKDVQVAVEISGPSSASNAEASERYYKNLFRVLDREYSSKLRQRELNMRTLLRQVKGHIKLSRTSERRRTLLEQELCIVIAKYNPLVSSNTIHPIPHINEIVAKYLFLRDQHIPETCRTLAECQHRVFHLETKLEEKDKELASHQERLQSLRGEIARIENDNQVLEASTSVNANLTSDLSSAIAERDSQLRDNAIRMAALELEIIELRAESRHKQSQLEDQLQLVERLRSDLQTLEETIARANLDKCNARSHASGLEGILNQMLIQTNNKSTNAKKARAMDMLQKSAKYVRTESDLHPLEECVQLLKLEMQLNHSKKSSVSWRNILDGRTGSGSILISALLKKYIFRIHVWFPRPANCSRIFPKCIDICYRICVI